jgi:hypothetical protein
MDVVLGALVGAGLALAVDRTARYLNQRAQARTAAELVIDELELALDTVQRLEGNELSVGDLDFGWLDVDAWNAHRAELRPRLGDEAWRRIAWTYREVRLMRRFKMLPEPGLAVALEAAIHDLRLYVNGDRKTGTHEDSAA